MQQPEVHNQQRAHGHGVQHRRQGPRHTQVPLLRHRAGNQQGGTRIVRN